MSFVRDCRLAKAFNGMFRLHEAEGKLNNPSGAKPEAGSKWPNASGAVCHISDKQKMLLHRSRQDEPFK